MAVFRLRTFYGVFLGLCFALAVSLLFTELLLSSNNDEARYDDNLVVVDDIQWTENDERIKKEDEKIFNFLEVDENWKERYTEGGFCIPANRVADYKTQSDSI